jgi:hypothetical protein
MSEKNDWPDIPAADSETATTEFKKALYQARLDVYKTELQAAIEIRKARALAAIADKATQEAVNVEREKAAYSQEYTLNQAVYNAYIEIAKEQVNVPSNKSDFVQKAATAISGAYIAIIGLSFGVGEHARALPLSGILPTVFLGISIFMSTAYSSYVSDPGSMEETVSEGSLPGRQFERRKNFITWAQSTALVRKRWLQTAVVSLGIAVFFLPAPYIQLNNLSVTILAITGIICAFLIPRILSS